MIESFVISTLGEICLMCMNDKILRKESYRDSFLCEWIYAVI